MATTTLAHRLLREDAQITYTLDDITIALVYAGEGHNGDYMPTDETDQPLLRLYVTCRDGAVWHELAGGSVCTSLAVDDDPQALQAAARYMHGEISRCVRQGRSLRKTVNVLSWLSAADAVHMEAAQ